MTTDGEEIRHLSNHDTGTLTKWAFCHRSTALIHNIVLLTLHTVKEFMLKVLNYSVIYFEGTNNKI